MGKSKILGIVLLVLGVACFGMYFVYAGKNSDFKVTFDSQGGTAVAEQIIKKGGKVTKPADPTKENSEFIEWQLDGVAYVFDNVVTKDMVLKANWKEFKSFNVKVTLEDKEYTADIREGNPISAEALSIPTKEGYRIVFYNDKNEEVDISANITDNMVLTAKYVEIKKFTVKFDAQGGSKVENATVEEGTQVTEPTSTRDGYILDGWYLGNEKFDFSTPIAKDITLKAKWTEKGKVNVIFKVDETVYKTIPVKEGTTVTKPANPTKKGYKFVEWQLDGKAFDFKEKINEETTLTATFEEAKSFTVSFNSDGGSKVDNQEVEAGGKAKKPTDPTKKGYVFKEWQLNKKAYDFNTEVNDDIALTAVWEKEEIKYTVKFDTQGGGTVDDQTVVEGGKASKPSDPTKAGYKFVEWLFNNNTYDFSTPLTSEFMSKNKVTNGTITITARYEKVTVTPTPAPTATPTASPTPAATPIRNTGDVSTTE